MKNKRKTIVLIIIIILCLLGIILYNVCFKNNTNAETVICEVKDEKTAINYLTYLYGHGNEDTYYQFKEYKDGFYIVEFRSKSTVLQTYHINEKDCSVTSYVAFS